MTPRPAGRFAFLASIMIGLLVAACAGDPATSPPEPDPRLYGLPTAADPWGHYIRAASDRFDVPEGYVRTVMQIESGGRTTLNGRPITSHAGAMGLMQIMPPTFRELERKHGLGPDPHDPWTNILAGTAYIREMYDLYGAPGFLAAYNCGPGCYGDHLAGRRGLPGETRRYLAKGSTMLAALEGGVQVASAIEYRPRSRIPPADGDAGPGAVAPPSPLTAALPPPVAPERALPVPATVQAPLRTPAPVPAAASGEWAVQVGAFSTPSASSQAAERARHLWPELRSYEIRISEVGTSAGILYRARLIGMNEQGANAACLRLAEKGAACVMVREG